MTITSVVIADSVSPHGIRLTSLQLRYPKFIHGEFMTHRVFSRNASSSRAIPVKRLIQDITDDPVEPWFGKNQRGMQARDQLADTERWNAVAEWGDARDHAIESARVLDHLGAHKQVVNRILEPFSHINVLVTSTEWSNFFALRDHPDAQPEIQQLARAMRDSMDYSAPRQLNFGDWHLPYVAPDTAVESASAVAVKLSVARCARVSYLTSEGKAPSIEDDLKLYDRLVGSQPMHASPAEHQGTPDHNGASAQPHLHGNFRGWIQYRKTLEYANA